MSHGRTYILLLLNLKVSLLASDEELVHIPSLADALKILNPQQTTHLLVLALSPSLSYVDYLPARPWIFLTEEWKGSELEEGSVWC